MEDGTNFSGLLRISELYQHSLKWNRGRYDTLFGMLELFRSELQTASEFLNSWTITTKPFGLSSRNSWSRWLRLIFTTFHFSFFWCPLSPGWNVCYHKVVSFPYKMHLSISSSMSINFILLWLYLFLWVEFELGAFGGKSDDWWRCS